MAGISTHESPAGESADTLRQRITRLLQLDYIESQGVTLEEAEELLERFLNNPRLVMLQHKSKVILFTAPSRQKFNEMVASGIPPSANTDREFLMGLGEQFASQPHHGDRLRKACEERGGRTKGRKYIASLARFPGDPDAWVSGRGDVQKVCEERGWGCEGAVSAPLVPKDPNAVPAVGVASDILTEMVNREVEGKDLSQREVLDTAEKVKDRLMPSWKK